MSFVSFLGSLFSSAVDVADNSARVIGELTPFFRRINAGEEVYAREFEYAYDVRGYNLQSKQADIKLLKAWDRPGTYVIINHTKHKLLVGYGNRIYQKVDRHLRGHGEVDIYIDYTGGCCMVVKFKKLEDTEFTDVESLFKDYLAEIKRTYKDYKKY